MNLITFIRDMLNFIFESEVFFLILAWAFIITVFLHLHFLFFRFIKRKFIDRG